MPSSAPTPTAAEKPKRKRKRNLEKPQTKNGGSIKIMRCEINTLDKVVVGSRKFSWVREAGWGLNTGLAQWYL